MRQFMVWGALVVVSTVGCGSDMGGGSTGGKSPAVAPAVNKGEPDSGDDGKSDAGAGRVVALSPANTKLEFVCAHAAPKPPDPRKGGFDKFTGKAIIDPATNTLTSLSVEIDTESIRTEIGGRLTEHLKSPDFFNAKEIRTASFRSKKITPGNDGAVEIVGDLTLHGVTKEISIPATVALTDDKLSLTSNFKIDRTDFDMKFDPGQVEKEVALSVAVNEK